MKRVPVQTDLDPEVRPEWSQGGNEATDDASTNAHVPILAGTPLADSVPLAGVKISDKAVEDTVRSAL